jgi:mannose-1-phosphate guanylyltransferase
MQIILLCGGAGKRLWPLSNGSRSKQFLKLLPKGDGMNESMVQRVVRQIEESSPEAEIVIATGANQYDALTNQASGVDIVTEPARRDTFPAIALACSYLHSVKKVADDEPVVVMPCDTYTESAYFDVVAQMVNRLKETRSDVVLMGITPENATTDFGYILPNRENSTSVELFVEKPTEAVAQKLISQGAYWNGGVFVFRLGYLLHAVSEFVNVDNFDAVRRDYDRLPKISFDYQIVEKAERVSLVPFRGVWKDLGTWDALAHELTDSVIGNARVECSASTTVINELNIPVVCYGGQNLIVAASPDGILVANKAQSDRIKSTVDLIDDRPMFEERRWGKYSVLDKHEYPDGFGSLTKTLTLNAGRSISYQKHNFRAEVWTFVDGEGIVVLDGVARRVTRGDVVHIPIGQMHALRATTPITFIEVQLGSNLVEEDIERFSFDWDTVKI